MTKCPFCGLDKLQPGEMYVGDTFALCKGHDFIPVPMPNYPIPGKDDFKYQETQLDRIERKLDQLLKGDK